MEVFFLYTGIPMRFDRFVLYSEYVEKTTGMGGGGGGTDLPSSPILLTSCVLVPFKIFSLVNETDKYLLRYSISLSKIIHTQIKGCLLRNISLPKKKTKTHFIERNRELVYIHTCTHV